MGQTNLHATEVYCQVHGDASGPPSAEIQCPLPHAIAKCPVCSLSWIGPGPDDSVVLCILTRHIVEIHPHTPHVTTLRSNAAQFGASSEPDDWCQHDPEQHRAVMVRSSARGSTN
jgi:hypothetical protein